jgi:hypothetical protein
VLDGQGSNRPILIEENAVVLLASMTVSDGVAHLGGGLKALDNSTVVLQDMVFSNNECETDGEGGAVYFVESQFLVQDSVFIDNDCGLSEDDLGNDGGAIATDASQGTIEGNLFLDNTAGDGSDIFVADSAGLVEIINNSFLGGVTSDSTDAGVAEWKGGSLLLASGQVLVANNLFGGHTATEGASGVFVAWGSTNTQILNNVFIYGSSAGGGAIHFGTDVQWFSPATIANNIVVSNDGWGVYSEYSGLPAGLTHNDVWDNSLGAYESQSLVQPFPLHSLAVDPLFSSVSDDDLWSNDDFTLLPASLCIDAGRFSPVWLDDDGTTVDMGLFGGPHGVWTIPTP